jgi:TPR repeat protein
LSLLKRIGNASFSVHRLVQKVIRGKDIRNQGISTFSDVSRRIETLFHKYVADDEKFGNILTLLPHVMTLLEHSEADDLKQPWDQAHSLRWVGRVLHTWYGKAGIYEQERSGGRGTHADLSLEEKPNLEKVPLLKILEIKEGEDADAWIDGQNIHPRIYNALGWMHAKGYYGLGKKDFEKRRDQVLRYLVTSFDKGDLNGPLYMGIIHHINKNDVEAKSWYNIAAFRGNFLAMHCLGKLYDEKRNYEKAEKWYKKAAKGKNPNAMNNLGCLYQHGLLDEKKPNYQKAMEWYKKAAALRNAPAINSLGCLYYEGQGIKKNDKRALELFQEAAKLGHADSIKAIRTIGNHYVNGKNGKGERITSDLKKAKECFEIAASLGDAEAMNELACFYEKGKGGAQQDKKQAKFWRDKAKGAGYKG